jgi:hypothetical protein
MQMPGNRENYAALANRALQAAFPAAVESKQTTHVVGRHSFRLRVPPAWRHEAKEISLETGSPAESRLRSELFQIHVYDVF